MNNDFDIRDGILYKYTGNSEIVVIPDSVHRIHEKAFRFCNTITSVEVPDSVTSIEWGAFSFCENLEYIKLPSTLKFIIFSKKPPPLQVGEDVTSVSAFEGCTKLREIIMEDNGNYYVRDNKIISKNDESYVISPSI